jgi:hypothetical protein
MGILNRFKRKTLVTMALGKFPKVVIASTGRAGSTMLCDVIRDSMIGQRYDSHHDGALAKRIRRWSYRYVVRLKNLPNEVGYIYKTHDILEVPPADNIKYVFIYGDPLESALSVEQVVEREGLDWFKSHQYHLRGSGEYGELFSKDVLNYRGQLENWLTQERDDVICIDFDDLWIEQDRLSKFLGFKINLPAKQLRKTKPAKEGINQQLFSELRNLKTTLKEKYLSNYAK